MSAWNWNTNDASLFSGRAKSVSEALFSRRSIRRYTGQPVTKADVVEILNAAARAPSGGNLQPWRVYVVSGSKRAELVAAVQGLISKGQMTDGSDYHIYPPEITKTYRDRRSVLGKEMFQTIGVSRTDRRGKLNHVLRNFDFFGAPVGLIFTIDRQMQQGQFVDLGIYMQSIMLLAREKGLATIPQEAWATFPRTVEQVLNIPKNEMLFCGMGLGYPDKDAPINHLWTERAPLEAYAALHGEFEDAKKQLSKL